MERTTWGMGGGRWREGREAGRRRNPEFLLSNSNSTSNFIPGDTFWGLNSEIKILKWENFSFDMILLMSDHRVTYICIRSFAQLYMIIMSCELWVVCGTAAKPSAAEHWCIHAFAALGVYAATWRGRAESESEVKNLEILDPDLKS